MEQEPKKDPLKAALEAIRQIDPGDDIAKRVLLEYVLGHSKVTREEVERDLAHKRACAVLYAAGRGEIALEPQTEDQYVLFDLGDGVQVEFDRFDRAIVDATVDGKSLAGPVPLGLLWYKPDTRAWNRVWPCAPPQPDSALPSRVARLSGLMRDSLLPSPEEATRLRENIENWLAEAERHGKLNITFRGREEASFQLSLSEPQSGPSDE